MRVQDFSDVPGLSDILRLQAAARPERVAIESDGRSTTYAALHAKSQRLARALMAAGVRPGDRVSTLMRNVDRVFEIVFGTVMARACLAPLNVRLAPAEIAKIVSDARPVLLFVSPELKDLARQALEGATAPRVVILDGEAFERFLSAADPIGALPIAQPDDDVIQLYTSGTTGLPKGVRHTDAAYRAMFALRHRVPDFAYDPDDVVLNVMPLFHIAGLNTALLAFASGAKLLLLPEFSPPRVLAAIGTGRVTKTLFAPVMIKMLLEAPELAQADLSSLRIICYGASPISETLLENARVRLGCGFLQLYGMTELAGAASALSPEDHDSPGRLRSCGRPWPGMDVRVVDGAGRVLAAGGIGEIVVRGPLVTKGYFDQPAATAEALRDGWLHTGDAGYFDEAGFLFIHDRVKDMIVSGGENIYPAEVENALAGCPGLLDVAVIGAPSESWGEQVTALVVPVPGAAVTQQDVCDWARNRIAAYKVPKQVEFVAAIPRNASGKILRRQLREPFWANADRAVG